jgi:hypothetical protein
MAGIFVNGIWHMGFDMDPTAAEFLTLFAAGTASTAVTPFGFGYAWGSNPGGSPSFPGISFGTNLTTVIVGQYVYQNALPGTGVQLLYGFYDVSASGYQVTLRSNTAGQLQFYRGTGTPGTAIGTLSSFTLQAGVWYYIEATCTISSTVGVVDCRINGGASICGGTGLNTQGTANTWVSGFSFGGLNTAGTSYNDDWYMLDTTGSAPLNAYLGPVQCRGEVPNNNSAVGGRNAWTPTNPTNVNSTNVGNIPAVLTKYNADSTVGDYDMFRYPNLPANTITVYDVGEWVLTELDSVGARTIGENCYSATPGGATDNLGTAFTPAPLGSPTMTFESNVVNPSGGGAWTVATAQAAELGLKVIS